MAQHQVACAIGALALGAEAGMPAAVAGYDRIKPGLKKVGGLVINTMAGPTRLERSDDFMSMLGLYLAAAAAEKNPRYSIIPSTLVDTGIHAAEATRKVAGMVNDARKRAMKQGPIRGLLGRRERSQEQIEPNLLDFTSDALTGLEPITYGQMSLNPLII